MDFLGLRNLSIIERCLELIEATGEPASTSTHVPLDDEKTFELLRAGHHRRLPAGGGPMRALIRQPPTGRVRRRRRPGRPLPARPDGGQHAHPLRRPQERAGEVEPLHPGHALLADTYQIMVYQEQVMQVAQEMAGYSMVEADNLRKAMGKKIKSVMDAEEEKFVAGCVAQGTPRRSAGDLFG
jgi:DNA polymerase III subunit alpha